MTRIFLLFVTILLSVAGFISLSEADTASADMRDIDVDNAIAGMREGSRITAPDKYGRKTEIPKLPGSRLSPADTGVMSASGSDAAAQAGAPGAGQGGASLGESSSGVIGGAGAGGLDIGGGGLGASSAPGQEQPIIGIEGLGETGGGTVEPGPETGITPDAGGSLIDLDANVGLDSGGVQTDVSIGLDTEQRDQILDADVGAGVSDITEASGSADITAGEITGDSELPFETTESAISSETDIGTEVDTSGGTVGGEADIGVEADVEGGGEGDDIADDPADGLASAGL